jgi:hypothetical protein
MLERTFWGALLISLLGACATPGAGDRSALRTRRELGVSAEAQQDTSFMREIRRLLHNSPVLNPSRGLVEEQRFIRDVQRLLHSVRADSAAVERIDSAEEAMVALEAFSIMRMATIRVSSSTRGFPVSIRRWAYRHSRTALWLPVRADTAIQQPAAAYQFRFRTPSTSRDTIISVKCHDDCDLSFP